MVRTLAGLLFAAMPAAALAQAVEVADGDWRGIPFVQTGKAMAMSDRTMIRIERLLEAGKCPRFGDGEHVKLDVPFLLQFDAGGAVQRVVVRRVDCPDLEGMIGGVIASRAKSGFYKPTGQNATGWYRSTFSYYMN